MVVNFSQHFKKSSGNINWGFVRSTSAVQLYSTYFTFNWSVKNNKPKFFNNNKRNKFVSHGIGNVYNVMSASDPPLNCIPNIDLPKRKELLFNNLVQMLLLPSLVFTVITTLSLFGMVKFRKNINRVSETVNLVTKSFKYASNGSYTLTFSIA